MGLRAKFNLLMLIPFALGLGLAGALSYPLIHQQARDAALQNAAIMMAGATAISEYTDHEIAPLLAADLKTRFLPQTIPFWAAQTNFRRVTEQFPNYTFKESALNPTNPADRPTDWEADIIDEFRRDPNSQNSSASAPTPTGPVLSVFAADPGDRQRLPAVPLTPAAAPPTMVDLYGPANGFGWKLGDTIGAQIVSVPMRVAIERTTRTLETLLGGLLLIFLFVYATMNLLLHFVVLRPVRKLAAVADEVSNGNMDLPEYRPRGRDEIASLADSFNRMRRSVANAMKLLER